MIGMVVSQCPNDYLMKVPQKDKNQRETDADLMQFLVEGKALGAC